MELTTRQIRPITIRTGGTYQAQGTALDTSTMYLLGMTANRENVNTYINGTVNLTGNDSDSDFTLPTEYWLGHFNGIPRTNDLGFSEFIAYDRDISSEVGGINSNINGYFNLY